MNKTSFRDEWHSLDEEMNRAGECGDMVRRLVVDTGQTELHLAVIAPSHQRILMVRMNSTWNEDLSQFPRWNGLVIATDRGPERRSGRKFLVLKQGDASPAEVFEALAADIVGSIQGRPVHPVLSVVNERLDRWKTFFTEHDPRGLSLEAQQGLYAELWFLQTHVLPNRDPHASIAHWTGSKRTNHDFQFPDAAVEIKSSSTKQHLKMHVASERQLDTVGLRFLYVVFLSLTQFRQGGQTLPALVDQIRKHLHSSPQAMTAFNEKLIEGGYLDAQSYLYTTGFAARDVHAFEVRSGFPRILESDLIQGVGDVSYSVVLAACEPFKIPLATVTAATGGTP